MALIPEHTTHTEHIRQDDVLFDYVVRQNTNTDHNIPLDDIGNRISQVEPLQLETLF